jgi:hypothetical protein
MYFEKMNNLRKIFYKTRNIFGLDNRVEEAKILSAKVLINQIRQYGKLNDIKEAEFKVFSQFGEDGIIQYLIRQTGIEKKPNKFIEFGVENYTESNTRFLMMNNNWQGLVIDGSSKNIKECRFNSYFWRYGLTATQAFVNTTNINNIFSDAGFSGEIGLLSIDIDGNDYWVWESINVIQPIIVICEYNSVFGADRAITVPYRQDFIRSKAHSSNLYFGCSLKALEILGKAKGYALVGSSSVGNNAFFIRKDKLNGLKILTTEEAYVESVFRESRNDKGELTYLSGSNRSQAIAGMEVYDVERDKIFLIKDLVNNKLDLV